MTGLSFGETRFGQRVIGNKIQSVGYVMPEGWANSTPTDPTWKMGGAEGKTDWAMLFMQPDSTLDLKPSTCPTHTYVQMFKKTEELVDIIKTLPVEKLKDLMRLSDKTAKSHMERFQSFHKLPPKQACLIFGGEGFDAADFTDSDRKYAEVHLRMISGLYGLLRPYDDVKPVRDVPMGGELETKKGKTVADFWGDMLTKQIVKDLAAASGKKPLLIFMVSDEYLKAVQPADLPKDAQVVRVVFEGGPEADTRLVRSQLARYIIRKRVTKVEDIKEFNPEDWALEKFKSGNDRVIFNWAGEDPADRKKDKKKKKDGEKGDKAEKGAKAERAEKGSSKDVKGSGKEKKSRARDSPSASPARSDSAAQDNKRSKANRRRDDSPSAPKRKGAAKCKDDRSRSRSRDRRGRDAKGRRSESP